MESSHRGLLQRPARLQWEGKKGEKGPAKQGAAAHQKVLQDNTWRIAKPAPLCLCQRGPRCKACLGSCGTVGDDQMVRNQDDECTDRQSCAPPL